MKVLLVGGGITAALTGFFLRKFGKTIITELDLWEAGTQVGGRMFTYKYKHDTFADIGAQYISTGNLLDKHYAELYELLRENGILEPLECKVLNSRRYENNMEYYTAPMGMNSLVNYFINETKFDNVCFSTRVNFINIEGSILNVRAENGKTNLYDMVILTIPAPEILKIAGNVSDMCPNIIEVFASVKYSTRFAFILFFDEPLKLDWGAQYIKDDDIFRYVAIDNIKRNRLNSKSAVVFHTDIEFGRKHAESPIEDVKLILKNHALILFPQLFDQKIEEVICYRWEHSQVISPAKIDNSYILLSEKPFLFASGDSFTGSSFDNCVLSAKETAFFISNKLK